MTAKRLPVRELVITDDDPMSGVDFVAFVDRPAIEMNWVAFNQHTQIFFAADDEQRIVAGPLMVPDMPIYRKVGEEEFYVTMSRETIQQIAYKYHRYGFNRNVNLMHDPQQKAQGVFMVQNYLIDRANNVVEPKYYGQELPDGTWFGMFRVENDAVWEKVKSGEIRGFSVEGMFGQVDTDDYMTETEFNELLDLIQT